MEDLRSNKIGKSKIMNTKNKKEERKINYKNIIVKENQAIKHDLIKNKINLFKKNEMRLLSFFYIFFILFPISFQKKNIRYLNSDNQITIIAKGTGSFAPFFSGTVNGPNKVTINGEVQSNTLTNNPLPESLHTIILTWNSPVTTCEYMFNDCHILISIDLTQFDISKVQKMTNMFNGCKNVKTIKFNDDIDTSNVHDMSYMFANCFSLESLDLSKFNTSSVLTMRSMFENCISLVSLDTSNFITNQVQDFSRMFYNASSLISLDLSK